MAGVPFKAVGAVVVLPAPGTGPAATACPAPHRHAALITQILDLLAGNRPRRRPPGPGRPWEPLSESELRVLRYLPTNLTGPEIAGELYVSRNTVKAHVATCTPSSVPIAGLRRSPGPGPRAARTHRPQRSLPGRARYRPGTPACALNLSKPHFRFGWRHSRPGNRGAARTAGDLVAEPGGSTRPSAILVPALTAAQAAQRP